MILSGEVSQTSQEVSSNNELREVSRSHSTREKKIGTFGEGQNLI